MRTSQIERASETREDHQETPAERTFSNHQGQINFYHKEAEQVKENAPPVVYNLCVRVDIGIWVGWRKWIVEEMVKSFLER